VAGSAPEPTEVLSTRRLLKSTNTSFPPPVGRSPYKTNIGSSPRRQSSVALKSQPRNIAQTPEFDRAQSQPAVNRRLDFLADRPRPSIEVSPPKQNSRSRRSLQSRPDLYELQPTPPQGWKQQQHNPSSEENIDPQLIHVNGFHPDDEPVLLPDDDGAPILETDNRYEDDGEDDAYEQPETAPEQPTSSPMARKKGKGKVKGQRSGGAVSQAHAEEMIEEVTVTKPVKRGPKARASIESSVVDSVVVVSATKRKRGRPRKSVDTSLIAPGEPLVANETAPMKTKKGSKKKALPVYEDPEPVEDEEEAQQPPAKRRKAPEAPKEQDPNVLMPPPKQPAKKKAQRATSELRSPSKRASVPRTLTFLRGQTPADAPDIRKTRSGRQVIKPLAYYLGEKVERDVDGTIQEIVRAESVATEAPPRRRTYPSRKHTSRRRETSIAASVLDNIREESEEPEEEWEAEGHVWRGLVRTWDPVAEMTLDDQDKEQDVGLSAKAIEAAGRDVASGQFRFAKLLSLPFFGGGLVTIPPGGIKVNRNSKSNQMMFFVHCGKVTVTVELSEFVISKGGLWHVPRGEFDLFDSFTLPSLFPILSTHLQHMLLSYPSRLIPCSADLRSSRF
jgi:centromere protein C